MFTQTKVTGGLVCHIGLLFWEFGSRRPMIWNLSSRAGGHEAASVQAFVIVLARNKRGQPCARDDRRDPIHEKCRIGKTRMRPAPVEYQECSRVIML